MATTCMDVFDAAMALMDAVNENSGATDTSDNKEYKVRTVKLINVLLGELYPISDTYADPVDGKRPIAAKVALLTDNVPLDDYLARAVLPYGLAAHLALTEDAASASFFQQRYEELRERYRALPAGIESIEDVYGIVGPYNEFSRWG